MSSKTMLRSNEGLMMILSPAKTLNLTTFGAESAVTTMDTTEPSCNSELTDELANVLKKKNMKDLKTLLKISDKLASSVFTYYESFELDSSKRNENERIPASFAFDGPAYKGLDMRTCKPKTLTYLQSNLRIIDPLYGSLRPMDLIQPYRLEMASKGILKDISETSEGHKSLASCWSESVTDFISKDLQKKENGKYLINLASDEYSAAINPDLLPKGTNYVKVAFQQEGRVIAVHAKRARGLMVRYISENQITDLDDVKKFDMDGYTYVEDRSDENKLIFDRPKTESKPKKKVETKLKPKRKADSTLKEKGKTTRSRT